MPAPSHDVEPSDITIVVPCYNEEASLKYLHETLRSFATSVTNLLRPNFVFVDDGSEDTTWEKLRAYFGDQVDCKLVRHQQNRGIAAAIITGLSNATSDLVAVIDADCTFDPMQLIAS